MNLTPDDVLAVLYLVRHHRARRLPVPPAVAALAARAETELRSATGPDTPTTRAEWISTPEAARRLGCSDRHIRRRARALGGRKIAGRWLIPTTAVDP